MAPAPGSPVAPRPGFPRGVIVPGTSARGTPSRGLARVPPPHRARGLPRVTRASSPAHPRAPLLRATVAPGRRTNMWLPSHYNAAPPRVPRAHPRGDPPPPARGAHPHAPGPRPGLLRVHVGPRPRGGPACPTSQASPWLIYRRCLYFCSRYRHPRGPQSRSTPSSPRHGTSRGPTARGLAPGPPSLYADPPRASQAPALPRALAPGSAVHPHTSSATRCPPVPSGPPSGACPWQTVPSSLVAPSRDPRGPHGVHRVAPLAASLAGVPAPVSHVAHPSRRDTPLTPRLCADPHRCPPFRSAPWFPAPLSPGFPAPSSPVAPLPGSPVPPVAGLPRASQAGIG